jgi:hypothetical protein
MNNVVNINHTLAGYYKVGVVDPNGNFEVKDEGKNLLLNQGMDQLYTNTVVDCITYGICGVGSRPNSVNAGGSQASQSSNIVYLSNNAGHIGSFIQNSDGYNPLVAAGDYIVFANTSQSRIVTVDGGGVNLTVDTSSVFDPQDFTIWKTTQVGLQTEVSRSANYVQGVGNCQSGISASTVTHRRTYDFPVNNWITVQFNELGVGWASSGANTVFSRIQIPPVSVVPGFRLRLIYDLKTSWSPTGSLYGSASIGGWPNGGSTDTLGTQSIQNLNTSTVNNDGSSNNNFAALDPAFTTAGSYNAVIWASTSSIALSAFATSSDRSGTGAAAGSSGMSKAAYVNGTYICDKTGTLTNYSSNKIRSFGFGILGPSNNPYPAGNSAQSFCFLMNQSQSLINTQQLSLTFRHAWSRTLA